MHIRTQIQRLMGGSLKYAAEMDSAAMIYIPSFVKIYLGFRKLIEGTQKQEGDFINILSRVLVTIDGGGLDW
jgi:hypothetical protein